MADAVSLAQKAANGDPRGFIDQLIQNDQMVTFPDGRSMSVKDLAEAEYYCSVSEAMQGDQRQGYMGYTPAGGMGYGGSQGGPGGSMANGGGGGNRAGYGGNMMGHSDPMSALRDMFATADPSTKAMLRDEISKLMM